jgi:hypothetical protein
MSQSSDPLRVLVGPRCLDDRICRLVYRRATDDVWVEEWSDDGWVRASALVRLVLKAPPPARAQLRRRGIPLERGDLDLGQASA